MLSVSSLVICSIFLIKTQIIVSYFGNVDCESGADLSKIWLVIVLLDKFHFLFTITSGTVYLGLESVTLTVVI